MFSAPGSLINLSRFSSGGRYEHTSSLLLLWSGQVERGAAVSASTRPPVSFITAAYEKRYSEVISVKLGTSQVFCHPWRLHTCEAAGGGSDALQHLSAGRGLSLHLQHPDNSYCSSRPTYSKQGGGPVINKSSLSALNASLEAGYIKDPTYTDMSAPSEDGRKTRSSGHMTDTSSPTYVIMWEKGGADVVNTLNTAWWFICTSQTDHLSTWTRKVCVWECYLGTHTKIWLVGIKLWC